MSEMPSVYKCDTRKARKKHKCYECGGAIQKGEQYHNHHGVWDGSGATYKVCIECDALRDQVDKNAHYDELTPFGNLYDSVFSCDNPRLMISYVYTAWKRGGEVREWFFNCIDSTLKNLTR